MGRATGKDHARINLDIWGDDEWLDLSPAAQHLYFVLWTSPLLSYCGTGEWHPGKIAAKSKGWTTDEVEWAGAELSRNLFLVIDTETSEFILRSWMKHDGLWRTPNMAVSMTKARSDLASRTLRGVVVFEAQKLRKKNPKSGSWERDSVKEMLEQNAVDPTTLEPFDPTVNPGAKGGANPWPKGVPNPGSNTYLRGGVKGGPKGGATPAPSPTSYSIEGYVSGEPHQPTDPGPEPSPYCSLHPGGTQESCRLCGDARKTHKAWTVDRDEYQRNFLAAFWCEVFACDACDPKGLINDGSYSGRCPNHDWEAISA